MRHKTTLRAILIGVSTSLLGCPGQKPPVQPPPKTASLCQLPRIREIAFLESLIRGPFLLADEQACTDACSKGDRDSCVALGIVHQLGTPKGADPIKAAKIFEDQCLQGSVVGCAQLGLAAVAGSGLLPDPERGVSLVQRACDDGDLWACSALGGIYSNGVGVDVNEQISRQLVERACLKGAQHGCASLGVTLVDSDQSGQAEVAKGITLLTDACAKGVARACGHLGYYHTGVLKDKFGGDSKEVRPLYEKACRGGFMEACTELGTSFVEGTFGDKDSTRGWVLLEKTCMAGYGRACDVLTNNPDVTVPLLEQGCANGSMVHCWHLGRLRGFSGSESPVTDVAKAVDALSKACNANEVAACADLGLLRLAPYPEVHDKVAGQTLLERACRAGHGRACQNWGSAVDISEKTSSDIRSSVLEIAELGCRFGNAPCCRGLGYAYYQWKVGETGTMVATLEKACRSNDHDACTYAGYIHAVGDRGPANLDLARGYARKACDAGNTQGCENAALMEMKRVPQDISWPIALQDAQRACTEFSPSTCGALAFVAAFGPAQKISGVEQQLERACSANDAESCNALSVMRFLGKHMTQDIDKSIKLAAKACNLGDGAACGNLGGWYGEGFGVPKDPQLSLEFYTKACEGGHKRGCAELGRMCWNKAGGCKLHGKPLVPSVLLDQVCNAGEADACVALGDGDAGETPPDPKAEGAFRRGCALPEGAMGCRKLGEWLLRANRRKEAADAIEKALLAGSDEAATTAWTLFDQGWLAPRKIAETLAESCNKKRSMNACYVRGVLLARKDDAVAADKREAVELFKQACQEGAIIKACTRYGLAQICGHGGITQDKAAGVDQLRKTCRGTIALPGSYAAFASFLEPRQGDKQACVALDALAAEVNVCAR